MVTDQTTLPSAAEADVPVAPTKLLELRLRESSCCSKLADPAHIAPILLPMPPVEVTEVFIVPKPVALVRRQRLEGFMGFLQAPITIMPFGIVRSQLDLSSAPPALSRAPDDSPGTEAVHAIRLEVG